MNEVVERQNQALLKMGLLSSAPFSGSDLSMQATAILLLRPFIHRWHFRLLSNLEIME